MPARLRAATYLTNDHETAFKNRTESHPIQFTLILTNPLIVHGYRIVDLTQSRHIDTKQTLELQQETRKPTLKQAYHPN